MAAKQVRVRRDTLTNLNAVIPADGEIAYNTTDDRVHMGDGATSGGVPHVTYKDLQKSYFDYAADSGSANAVTIALPYAPASYTAGLRVKFKANATNTGATTINVNSLGTKNLQKYSAGTLGNLVAGDVVNGGVYEAIYDGTQFQLLTLQNAGITSVSQGDLNTSTGTFSGTSGTQFGSTGIYYGTSVTAPGGQYGFCIETKTTTGIVINFWPGSGTVNTYAQTFRPIGDVGQSSQGQQRYITSSPPFDIGDGEVGGFVFLLVDNSGDVKGHYAADVPPWGYNGPTNIRAARICPVTGKKFRRVMKKRSLEEVMDGAQIIFEEQEITHAIKNADMGLIPSPFVGELNGLIPILLDPMDDRIRSMIDYQNAGGSDEISDAIVRGFIKADNSQIERRKGPPGVAMHRLKFKYTGKK